jgi:PAS domain S-box-containing protein
MGVLMRWKWSIERKSAAAFGVVFLVVVVIGLVAYQNALHFIETNRMVAHTLIVRQNLEDMRSTLYGAESGQRGYVLTGEEKYLSPYKGDTETILQLRNNLEQLRADNASQQERLARLSPLLEDRIQQMDSVIQLRANTGFEVARQMMMTNNNKNTMDTIQSLIADIKAEENRLLENRSAEVNDSARGTLVTFSMLTIFTLGLLLLIYWFLSRNLAERRRTAKAVQKYADEVRSLYDTAPCGYHSLDKDGIITQINETELSWIGYRPEEIIGKKKFSDIITSDGLETFRREFPAFKERGWVHNLEFALVRRDGTTLPVLLSATAIKDSSGQYLSSRSTLFDMTEQKEAEEKVRKLNLELQTANRELESFAYSVSHDLRAPLRSIDGFSQALLEDYGDQFDATAQSYLHRVRAAAQRMAELIDNLLSLSQITRKEMQRETLDLSALSQIIIADLQKTDPERTVEFRVEANLTAEGDIHLMRIALENLLGNAWKYTQKQTMSHIEVGKMGENGQTVYFVRDDGAGFDMAYAGKLFGAFQRLHTTSEFEGTGIGLATVQRIIHRHGGRVWAEGAVGQGATFYFTL